ncbi:Oxr1, partial [Symbiodinium microadriaticum]
SGSNDVSLTCQHSFCAPTLNLALLLSGRDGCTTPGSMRIGPRRSAMVASRSPSRSPTKTPRTPRVQRISDEALCLQMQQFLDNWHYVVMKSSLGKTMDRLKVVEAALQVLALNGVPIRAEEIPNLVQADEEVMIYEVIDRIPEGLREGFEHLTLELIVVVTSAARMRTTIENNDPGPTQALLEEESGTAFGQSTIKRAILQAATEVAKTMRCKETWAPNMAQRLDRLNRSAEIAEESNKRLLVVEAQLNDLPEQRTHKAKQALMGFVGTNKQALKEAAWASWHGAMLRGKGERNLRERYTREVEEAETALADFKAAHLNRIRGVMFQAATREELDLLVGIISGWRGIVLQQKAEAWTADRVQALQITIGRTAKDMCAKLKQVMMRMLLDYRGSSTSAAFAAWVQFSEAYKKDKDFEDSVKKFEGQMKAYMEKKKEDAKLMLSRVSAATDTGLLQQSFMAWTGYAFDGKKLRQLEDQVDGNDDEVVYIKTVHREIGSSVSCLAGDQIDLNSMYQCWMAWQIEAKTKRIDKYYSVKIDSKRKQLASVQMLFKSFAEELDAGLKDIDKEAAGDSSERLQQKSKARGVGKSDAVYAMAGAEERSAAEVYFSGRALIDVSCPREVNESNLVVCIDICDRDAISGTDSFMCRGQVPLRSAWEAATKGRSVVSPQWVNMTPSAGGRLQVGFSTSPAKDQLIVHIMGAEKLPGRATSGLADPFCLVRLAFMGQLGEPTDQVTTPAGELRDGTETLFFQHQEVLELPGALSEGMVAAGHPDCFLAAFSDAGWTYIFSKQVHGCKAHALHVPSASLLLLPDWAMARPGTKRHQTFRRQIALAGCLLGAGAVSSCFCNTSRSSQMQSKITRQGAKETMESFYSAVNNRDLERAMEMVDDDATYEDFTFQEPFKGKEGVRELLEDAMELPKGLDFVIDETAGGESWSGDDSVGMTWHVEFDGVPLPNSRGASLYKTRGGKLFYARDIVESPLKLGGAALGIVGFIAPIIRALQRGSLGDLAPALAFATAGAIYWYILLLSPQGQFSFLAGPPAWAIDETTLRNVIDESLNFFYIWPGLDTVGLPSPTSLLGIALPSVDPLRLALFNLAEAYAFMLLPLLLWDRPKRQDVYNWWAPAMFLTNAILLPYFAVRGIAGPSQVSKAKPSWAPLVGLSALAVAVVALWQSWGLWGNFLPLVLGDRVAFAFAVDCTLFAVLQAYVFAETAGPAWRFVPFLGLVAWLLLPAEEEMPQQEGQARASWHYQVDLVDMKKQEAGGTCTVIHSCAGMFASSSQLPDASQMLDEICRTEGRCEVTQYTIREKLEESKSFLQKPSTPDPFADDVRCGSVLRKMVLKQLDKPYKAALELMGDQGVADAAGPKAKRKQVGEAIGSALVTLGLRNNTERVDRGTDDMELYVRFQVVSRWKGLSRGSRSPPSVPMRAPSAVRCIATLANSIVAGYEDGNVFVWDACGQSSPLHQFQAHEVPVSAIAVLPPLGCVVTAGEVRNGLEAFSESRIRLWSTVTLELRQSVSLNGSVARVLRPLVLGAAIEDIMRAAEKAGRSIEKREKVVPPCLAVGTDSRQAKQVRLMRVSLDVKRWKEAARFGAADPCLCEVESTMDVIEAVDHDGCTAMQVPVHFVVVTNEPGLKLGSKAKALVLIERQMHIIDPLVKRKILLESRILDATPSSFIAEVVPCPWPITDWDVQAPAKQKAIWVGSCVERDRKGQDRYVIPANLSGQPCLAVVDEGSGKRLRLSSEDGEWSRTTLLSPVMAAALAEHLPASLQWKTAWRLIYSPRLNGVSLKTFFRRMQGEGPTLLLLQDHKGHAFGGFASSAWHITDRYYGTGESFVFRFRHPMPKPVVSLAQQMQHLSANKPEAKSDASHSAQQAVDEAVKLLESWRPKVKEHAQKSEREVLQSDCITSATEALDEILGAGALPLEPPPRATAAAAEAAQEEEEPKDQDLELEVFHHDPSGDGFFLFSDSTCLAMGGGSGFALYVEKDLLHGRSDPSTTFNSEVLSCETSFIIGDLECWAFDDPTQER